MRGRGGAGAAGIALKRDGHRARRAGPVPTTAGVACSVNLQLTDVWHTNPKKRNQGEGGRRTMHGKYGAPGFMTAL